MTGYGHLPLANGVGVGAISGASKYKHIALGARDIFACGLLDLIPRASVMAGILRHNIGQTKALRHGLIAIHIARGGHMPTIKTRTTIIAQSRPSRLGQARLFVKATITPNPPPLLTF